MIHQFKKKLPHSSASIYKALWTSRAIEERMLNLLRQNRISKWFSGIGQEAVSVGTALSSLPEDYILPMHRNLGVFTSRGVPYYPLFCQLFGKADGFSKGRERSFHFGIPEYHIIGMISHLAAMMPVATGLALAKKLKKESSVVFSFCGDGASSEGDFHEAINLASVWKLPVVFIIENNGYGLSTPVNEQYACKNLSDRALGYGIKGLQVDGNDILAVLETISEARKLALKGRPVLVEALTFRMRGHEEASGVHYVPEKLLKEWAKKDPIIRFEKTALENGWLTGEEIEQLKTKVSASFEEDLQKALNAPKPTFSEQEEIKAIFASFPAKTEAPSTEIPEPETELRFIDAIRLAMKAALKDDPAVLLMGQDVAEYGGVFKASESFSEEFGKERIRNTPIIESGAIGAAYGLALDGFKPIVEMQFADFVSCGFNQIINNLAKSHYRWSPGIPVTIRAPHGAGVGAGPFHSQSPEGWFMQHPGLKIVVPATVEDARDLLYTSIFDPNPVLFFEHKKLYRSIKTITSPTPKIVEFGKAAIRRSGTDATIITFGLGVHWALELAEEMNRQHVSIEVIDLRTLVPLDIETIQQSVRKTHRVLLLQEASQTLGPMSEISALITENCFEFLDAPVIRCSSLDIPIPFSRELEDGYLATKRAKQSLERLLHY